MQNRSAKTSIQAIVFSLVAGLFFGCASPHVAVIGSPYERYDHNRQYGIADESLQLSGMTLLDETYTPFGSSDFPALTSDREGDQIPDANIVPIFTGVLLPLSDASEAYMPSDREDLIDFLAAGPRALDGVERKATMGDVKAAEETYKPLLDLFASMDRLSGQEDQIRKDFKPLGAVFADEIIDARYTGSSFQSRLGILYRDFWFILFKLPERDYYSRLVVAPAHKRGQNREGKKL